MSDAQHRPAGGIKRVWLVRWLALWPLTVALMLYPVSNRILRVATVAMLAVLWCGCLWVFWQKKWLRTSLIGLPALLILFALLPGHPVDRTTLGRDYVTSLRGYEGCRYMWGGENRLGIDCSGLVRAALVNASLRDSVQTLNPALLRFALDLWWHDGSAQALGGEYRQQTVHLFAAPGINSIESGRLQPGDLAVTRNGIHVLAYLGNDQWIEADPGARHVVIVPVPTTNAWFSGPVNIMRWRVLDEATPPGPIHPRTVSGRRPDA